jgi:4-carboxymuconolactone decarboxylase
MANKKPETTLTVDGLHVHSLYVGTFPDAVLSNPHITARRLHREGFSDEFLEEALTEVQYPLFGRWGLIGEKGSNDTYADRCSVYIFGQFYGRDGLALKTRGLLVLAGLSVLLRDGVMPTWTNACLNLGWTEDQLKELGALVSHVGGFPPSRGTLMIYDDVFEKRRAVNSTSTSVDGGIEAHKALSPVYSAGELYSKGCELATLLFGTPDGDFADLPISPDDDFRKEMVTWLFGYLFTERSLIPLKEKVLVLIAMSVASGCQNMVRRWIGAARNASCTRLEVQETILTMVLYGGWPVARDSLDILAQEWPVQSV